MAAKKTPATSEEISASTSEINTVIDVDHEINLAIEILSKFPVVGLDTETNGEDVRDGSGYLRGISISGGLPESDFTIDAYIPYRSDTSITGKNYNADHAQFAKLKKAIEEYQGYLVFHNAKFDLVSLSTAGINYTGKFYCTLQIAHLVNENFPYSKTLENCCIHYLKEPGKLKSPAFVKTLAAVGWAKLPAELAYAYAKHDSSAALRLWFVLKKYFDAEGLQDYWEHKQQFFRVIIAMERRGIGIDIPACEKMITIGTAIMEDCVEILGVNPGSSVGLKSLLIDQLGLPVVKRSIETGKPSFDKYAMEVYDQILERQNSEVAQLILTYRGWQKAISSNYKAYLALLGADGFLHANYKLHGTVTGRMSCEQPNLQQIPRAGDKPWNGKMKAVFKPRPGYELYEGDYGQLELRLGSGYGKVKQLLQAFAEGRDVFTEMATQLGMSRHDTKTLTYTIQYGGGIKRLSEVFSMTKVQAQKVRNNFYNTYPGFRAISNLAQSRVKANGKVRLWSGRYRHFMYPDDESHKAFNSVVQGGAADIVERAMVRLFNEVDNEEECRMLLQVHDSVVFEIRKDKVEEYLPKINMVMVDVGPGFDVVFAADIHKFGD